MSFSQPQSTFAKISDSWRTRVSRACANIVVCMFLPHVGRSQLTKPHLSLTQRPFNTTIDSSHSDDGVRAVARACIRGWRKWRCGAGTAMTFLSMVVVLICAVVLDCRRRSYSRRALRLPCGAINQNRQRRLSASRVQVSGGLGVSGQRVLRKCDLDSVSQLVKPVANVVPDRCAICLEAMTSDFQDDMRGASSSSSSSSFLRVLRCDHRFHAHCVDPWLTTCCSLCPMCKSDICDRT